MAMLHRALATSLTLSLVACSAELAANHPAPSSTAKQAQPPSAAASFQLRIDNFNWEVHGSELTVVNGDGSAEHVDFKIEIPKVGMPAPQWYLRRFQVSADVLTGLQQLLANPRFVELEPLYINREIHDGANTSFAWKNNGVTKSVQCSNQYPAALIELRDYVQAHIIDVIPRTVRAERITHQQMEALSHTTSW